MTEPDKKTMLLNINYTSGSKAKKKGLYTFSTNFKSSVPTTLMKDYFVAYSSKSAGAFFLLDKMKIPRACAYQSEKLASVKYYRGQ